MPALDLAAELRRHGLLAVADAEHRGAGLEQRVRRPRRGVGRHGFRTARQTTVAWASISRKACSASGTGPPPSRRPCWRTRRAMSWVTWEPKSNDEDLSWIGSWPGVRRLCAGSNAVARAIRRLSVSSAPKRKPVGPGPQRRHLEPVPGEAQASLRSSNPAFTSTGAESTEAGVAPGILGDGLVVLLRQDRTGDVDDAPEGFRRRAAWSSTAACSWRRVSGFPAAGAIWRPGCGATCPCRCTARPPGPHRSCRRGPSPHRPWPSASGPGRCAPARASRSWIGARRRVSPSVA